MIGCHFRCIFLFLCALQDKTQEIPGEQALGEPHLQMSSQAQDQEDSDSTSTAPVLDSASPANTQL